MFVWHPPSSDDVDGWVAYEANPPGAPEDCFLSWDLDDEVLSAGCVDRDYPADGEGLQPVAVEVDDDGRVILDLATEADTDTSATTE